MSQEQFAKTLVDLGLTSTDVQVYLFLAKRGTKKGKDILNALRMNRQLVYRSLKNLQNKGMVSSTFERPARFSVVSLEKILDRSIEAKIEETRRMKQNKAKILSTWQSIELVENIDSSPKFMVIQGRKNILAKIFQTINETKSELLAVSNVQGLMHARQIGLLETVLKNPFKNQVQFRFLTELSQENMNTMEGFLKEKPACTLNFKGRDVGSSLKLFPRLVIKDEEELVFFITSFGDTPTTEQEDAGIWTNNRALVHAFKTLFEELWRNSSDLQKTIDKIKAGEPICQTTVIKDAEAAYKIYAEILESAKAEIISITSSKDLTRFWKNATALTERAIQGFSIRIMAPLTDEYLETAQLLSKYYKVRNLAKNFLRITLIDGKHLFMFKTPSADREKLDYLSFFEDTFYTNDLEFVDRAKDMLESVWRNASPIS